MWSDVRFGLRILWKQRAFTAVAVVTLAVAMGMGDTVYTIVNAMILRGLPVRHPDRVVMFNDRSPNSFPLNVSYRDVALGLTSDPKACDSPVRCSPDDRTTASSSCRERSTC